MTTYIEYQLEDGTTILIRANERRRSGTIETSITDKVGDVIESAGQTFEDAFSGVKRSASALRKQLEDLRADEVEVTFGLEAGGEAGNFAIGKVNIDANYTVKLKWSNKSAEE